MCSTIPCPGLRGWKSVSVLVLDLADRPKLEIWVTNGISIFGAVYEAVNLRRLSHE